MSAQSPAVPGTGTLHASVCLRKVTSPKTSLFTVNLRTRWLSKYMNPPFTSEKTKVWKGSVACLSSHTESTQDLNLDVSGFIIFLLYYTASQTHSLPSIASSTGRKLAEL